MAQHNHGYHKPWAPSLDQIEPGVGYTIGNVRCTAVAYNRMRGQLPDEVVRDYCERLLTGQAGPDHEAGRRLLETRVAHYTLSANLLRRWRSNAKQRGLDFHLTRNWLDERLAAGVCEVTGLSLSWEQVPGVYHRPLAPSPDRINCSEGYTEDNVRLVCSWYNYARADWPDSVVRTVAEALVRNNTVSRLA